MRRVVLIAVLVIAAASTASATNIDSTTPKASRIDTVHFKMTKDPWLAFGLSAALPGAGQVYLGQWYKTPFIIGGISACIVAAIIQNGRYHYTSDSVNNQLARGDTYNAARYTSVREFYRDDRDKWYIYAGLVYVVNLLDAYIAANLYDFDVSDPTPRPYISIPNSSAEPWRLGVNIRF
ncbi:MAG TPA: DUF5683 domain-containing protein [Candidatus Kapabacteria bacterium]|nr:DUF5683 domain-containing protein [Candidatus Kapabacteria bacterium]